MTVAFKVKTEPHPEFKAQFKKCVTVATETHFYAFFGEARHFMEMSEGFKFSGCLSKFAESEGAPFAKALRESGQLPEIETQESIRQYFGHADNLFV